MIIAVTGKIGAGKDVASAYVERHLPAKHVSGGDVLREMLTSIGLEPKKSALGDFGTFIRSHYGGDASVLKVLEKAGQNDDIIISGIRSPHETQLVHQHSGKILYIEASDNIRYPRIINRQRGGEAVDIETLKKIDARETGSDNPLDENLDKVKAMADEIIVNESDFAALYAQLDVIITKYRRAASDAGEA